MIEIITKTLNKLSAILQTIQGWAVELEAFNAACNAWKQQCLTDGWQEKDAVNWEAYEKQLA